MLSYRHAFHAGNYADVLKHWMVIEILKSLGKKDKTFEYIDTHAGAGRYDLNGQAASKLAEHSDGIGKLQTGDWPELEDYFDAIAAVNTENSNYYPGSPLIADQYIRPGDRSWLYELHSSDAVRLTELFKHRRSTRVAEEDGFQGLMAHIPPTSRRALVLMDPSYELKSDYDKVFLTLDKAHEKFSTGVYALWYPVVERERIDRLHKQFTNSGIRRVHYYELGVRPDDNDYGMTSSGMLIINPPWGLHQACEALLPRLAEALKQTDKSIFRCEILVDE